MTQKRRSEPVRDDYDSPWKEALERYFPEFLALLFPAIYKKIDWSRRHEPLDKELQQVVRDAELGRRYADKLIKVWTLMGKERWVLIHVEVQGSPEPDFDERMYVYNYRLFDRYRVDIVSLAVLADPSPGFKAGEYRRDYWGCRVHFCFPTVKLLELEKDRARLEESENPFSLVVMAHLAAQRNRDGERRLDVKLRLIRLMYRRGYSKDRIVTLFRLIDWFLYLPQSLAPAFEEALSAIEEEQKVAYISSIEQLGRERGIQLGMQQGMQQGVQQGIQQGMQQGMQQGIQQGMQQGMQQGIQQGMQQGMQQGVRQGGATVLNRLLQRKFGETFTDIYRHRVDEADPDTLLDWSERVLSAQFIDEVFD